MTTRTLAWDLHIDATTVLWRGRRLRVDITLVNRGAVAAIPDPRRLRPTLRDIQNQGLAVADITRLSGGALSVFRPVVPPGGSVKACLQFERLPPDRPPVSITIGEPDLWTLAVLLADPAEEHSGASLELSTDDPVARASSPVEVTFAPSASPDTSCLDMD